MLIMFLVFLWTPTLIAFMNMSSFSPPFSLKLQTAKVFCVPLKKKNSYLFPRAEWGCIVHMTTGYKVLIYTAERDGGVV